MIQLDDYLVGVEFLAGENSFQANGFHLRDSYLRLIWGESERLYGSLQLGSQDLVGSTRWYEGAEHNSIFTEAYGNYSASGYLIQFGMLPVGFSFSGQQEESQLLVRRNLLYLNDYLTARDLGLAFRKQMNSWSFYTVLHNGIGIVRKSEVQNDDRFFVSMGLDKKAPSYKYGIGFQTGQFSRVSVANELNAKNHILSVYALKESKAWVNSIELYAGKESSQGFEINYSALSLESIRSLTERTRVFLKLEYFDPNSSDSGDQIESTHLGLDWSEKKEQSRLSVFYNLERNAGQINQSVSLMYRLGALVNSIREQGDKL
ncbi:MAG: hypothetical protein AB8E15_01525 [Bdellovibrionales bacterium]